MRFTFKLITIFILSMLVFCQMPASSMTRRFFRMDTVTEITLVGKNKNNVDQMWKSIDSILVYWEEQFSVQGQKSQIRVCNERTTDTVKASPVVCEIISRALSYGDTLGGGFDITILPLKVLWGFDEQASGDEPLPGDSAIRSTLEKVNYKNVQVRNDTVFFQSKETQIDVGGIAKGFVLRELGSFVELSGFTDYLIVAGGDIVSGGQRPDKKPWRIGVQHPRANDSILAVLELKSGSVVTSGDYERFRIIDGKRYHHIFDSHTGYCCTKNQSVTISGPDPVEVDVMSTGLFCRDAQDILNFINKRDRFECLVVDSTGGIFISDGWKNSIEILGR